MKKLLFLLSFAVSAALYSCAPTEENGGLHTESSIKIEVDKQSINIDNSEKVTFTVLLNGEDVTADSQIVNITDGGYAELSRPEFTTLRPGTHTFFAIHPEGNSDKVSISAISESNVSSTFYRRNIAMKFTATDCTYCPAMTTAIKGAMKLYPDRLIEVAAHCGDELSTSTSTNYQSQFAVYGLPTLVLDMDSRYKLESRVSTTIVDYAKKSLEGNPTVAGVKMSNSYAEGKLSIDMETTFAADGNYKVIVWLLQSGYNYSQAGAADDSYTQDHVIFTTLTDPSGDLYNERVAGEKIQENYEFDYIDKIGKELDTDQTTVVICVLNDVGDARFVVNNAASAGVNESVDYQYEQIVTE